MVDAPTAVARILADTNALRAANGKAPLVENVDIDRVAAAWAQRMSVPTSQGGPGFVHNASFFTQMPSGATSGGENIAAGFTYQNVVSAGWAKSPGHLQNMLGDWTDIGIGYWQSADGSTTYFVQDFGYYPAHVGVAPAAPRHPRRPRRSPRWSGTRSSTAGREPAGSRTPSTGRASSTRVNRAGPMLREVARRPRHRPWCPGASPRCACR
nr:CAP domain-containing protein [Pseudolysinimonas kribbensis]